MKIRSKEDVIFSMERLDPAVLSLCEIQDILTILRKVESVISELFPGEKSLQKNLNGYP